MGLSPASLLGTQRVKWEQLMSGLPSPSLLPLTDPNAYVFSHTAAEMGTLLTSL